VISQKNITLFDALFISENNTTSFLGHLLQNTPPFVACFIQQTKIIASIVISFTKKKILQPTSNILHQSVFFIQEHLLHKKYFLFPLLFGKIILLFLVHSSAVA
jgi:hypothetical protein